MPRLQLFILPLILGLAAYLGAGVQAVEKEPPPNGRKVAQPSLKGKIVFSSYKASTGPGKYDDEFVLCAMNADGSHQTTIINENSKSPCFSPDGIKIVYAGFPFSHAEFYLMNADGSGCVLLDATLYGYDGYGGIQPHFSFSPDGKQIAYTSGNGNAEIYVMNVDGTGKTQLTKDGGYGDQTSFYPNSYSPCFSPDGKKIVFVSDRDWTHIASGSSNEIFIMNADGTNQTRLTHNDDDDGSPCFSPDGKQIVYTSVREGKSQIFIMDADGTHLVRLTKDNGDSPCFSPDGKQIAYSFERKGRHGIFVMNADGSNAIRLTDGQFDYSPSWAPGFVPVPTPVNKAPINH